MRLLDAAEENMVHARRDKKFAAANGALRLIAKAAGLLDGQQPTAPRQVTRVTVVLSGPTTTTVEGAVVDGTSRLLPDAAEAP